MTPALLAPEQAALAPNVSRDRLLALVRAGTIAAVRLGPRTIRVPSSEIDRLAGEALASRHAEAEGARERRGQRVPPGDLKMAQSVLGHATIGLTADTYTHVQDSQLRRAADALDDVVGGKG